MSQHLYHSTDHPSGMSNHHTYMHRASNTRILLHVQVHYGFAQRARRTKSHSPRHRGSPRWSRAARRTPSCTPRIVRKDRAHDRSPTPTGSRTRHCVARSWLLGEAHTSGPMDRTSSRSLCRGPRERLRFWNQQVSKIPGPRKNLPSGEGGQAIIDHK